MERVGELKSNRVQDHSLTKCDVFMGLKNKQASRSGLDAIASKLDSARIGWPRQVEVERGKCRVLVQSRDELRKNTVGHDNANLSSKVGGQNLLMK